MRGRPLSPVDFTGAVWRKSSRSGGGSGGNCVEVAFSVPAVWVRDSKRPDVGRLTFPSCAWQRFVRQ
ncbi:hypothetical protein F4560_005592 [Saccharothrix ecbatanensis]|uniref:DUF397 domain-containing protein n=1 Tax=Saccharothrix ecbatanensis TaxID=1105145 RepID=A0A7W9HPZ9_9PSEU|nr:DUF397 domain-containing protein [Saccharothrix ecbatanensis]MBB5805824.1 hypothetical protein [Saccharothrix ecbatanensis]